MFGPTTSEQQRAELKKLFADVAKPGDSNAIQGIYRRMADQLASALGFPDAPKITVVHEGRSEFVLVDDELRLNPLDGTSADSDGRWMELMHATAWHEFGHGFFPNVRLGLTEKGGLAFNLLEDLRVEARMTAGQPEARNWLRANIIDRLGDDPESALRADAKTHGWSSTLTLFAGRSHSGVITDSEAAAVRALAEAEGSAGYEDLAEIWKEYVELSDDDAHQPRRDQLIAALAATI